MKVLIVGAGIGGLAAAASLRRQGHEVIVYEQSELNQETGAAIFLPPNVNGPLRTLGFKPEQLGANSCLGWRQYTSDGELFLGEDFSENEFPHPWQMIHRQELHRGLKDLASDPSKPGNPAQIVLSKRVLRVEAESGTIHFQDGASIQGDVVLGADGMKSAARTSVKQSTASDFAPFSVGKSCYRFLIPRSVLLSNPLTEPIFKQRNALMVWLSEDTRLVCYPCDDNATMNFVAIHPAEKSEAVGDSWHEQGRKDTLLSIYRDFALDIRTALQYVDEASIKLYPLMDMAVLSDWTTGRLALLGDAAHPFLPHLGQGGAQAIEDGLSLGVLLSKDTNPTDVPARLELYQKTRKARVDMIQEHTRISGLDLSELSQVDYDREASRDMQFLHDEIENSTEVLKSYLGSASAA